MSKENFKDLPFYSPIGTMLLKSDDNDDSIIYLEASNEEPDEQKDVVFQKALEDQVDFFLKKGVLSWDHMHKVMNDPQYIIGEPLDVKFSKDKTLVKGKLYSGVPYAESVRRLARAKSTRLGASIGGFITGRRDLGKSLKGVTKVLWDETAITYKPVNEKTLGSVSLIPPQVFAKALMAGSGVATADLVGGRALIQESLQGNRLNTLMNKMVKLIQKGKIKDQMDLSSFLVDNGAVDLYDSLANVLKKKFKEK